MYVTAFEHEYTQNASHHALLYTTGLTPDAVSGYAEGFVEDCIGGSSASWNRRTRRS